MHGRWCSLLLAGIASAVLAPAAQAAASDAGAAIATVLATAHPSSCRATLDQASAQASPTPSYLVTAAHPAGYEVSVPGTSDPNAAPAGFNSLWLVTSGRAYPRNVPAARLYYGCAATTFAPTTYVGWHALDYIDPDTGTISAWSNLGWVNAAHVRAFDAAAYENQLDEEEAMPIWTSSCPAGRQTAHFTRTFDLLGVPAEMRVSVQGLIKGFRRWPFSSITMRMNGATLVRQTRPGYVEQQLTATQLRAVEYGSNRFEVIVVKKKTGACNGSARQKLAVLISVLGRQAWTVKLTRPSQQSTTASESGSSFPPIPFTITNYGPSVLLEPRLHFSVVYDQDVKSLGPRVEGNSSCTSYTQEEYAVVCGGAKPLGPGDAVTFPVQFFAVPKDYDFENKKPYVVRFTEYWDGSLFPDGLASGSFCSGGNPNCPAGGGA